VDLRVGGRGEGGDGVGGLGGALAAKDAVKKWFSGKWNRKTHTRMVWLEYSYSWQVTFLERT
jgi:hypothetical protein